MSTVGLQPRASMAWRTIQLGEFVSLQRGHDLPEHLRREGSVPVMGAAGANGSHDVALVKGPGVVLGRSGASYGEAHLCLEDYWPHNTALYVTDFRRNEPLFVYYFLDALDFSRYNSGGAQPSLNRNFIYPIKVAVPDGEEQRAIAGAMSDVDALIGALDKLIAKKRAIKLTTMQYAFSEAHGRQGWTLRSIRRISQIPVTDGPHTTPQFVNQGVPFLSVNNLVDNKISLIGLRHISPRDHAEFSKKCKPQKGDLLLGKAASVGQVAIVELEIEFNIWSPIALIRLNSENVPKYVYYALQTNEVQKQLALLTNSSSQGNIGMRDIERILVPLAPKDDQVKIAALLSAMDLEISALERRRDKTNAIKQGMMQQLLTGRIRLV